MKTKKIQVQDVELIASSEHVNRLEQVRLLSRLMDDAIEVPGTNIRVGLDALIGLIPAAGDIISGAFSLYLVRQAAKLGVSRVTLTRMCWNVAVDMAVGVVPVAGDMFDAAWKCNKKNLDLLERHIKKHGFPKLSAQPEAQVVDTTTENRVVDAVSPR